MDTNQSSTPSGADVSKSSASPGMKSLVRMGVFTLVMINVSAVVSLRGMPAESTYGLSSVFYYVFAAVFFLIPVSLVAAELTTGWPQKGGVYRWMGEAFGSKFGFLAIWLQWIQTTIWFPTVLTFAAVSLAFMGPGQRWDESLAQNKWYVLVVVLVVYWGATLLNFRGMQTSGTVTKWGSMIGTIIPAALLIILGGVYCLMGESLDITMNVDEMIPDLSNFNNLVLAASIFLFYAGMEMSAVHVKDINNPGRNYPMAIFISALVTVVIFVFGTLAVGFIIPEKDINLVQSLLIAYDRYFAFFNVNWMGWILAFCLALGVLAQVTAWVMGPSKGLYQVGMAGNLPPFMQKTNKNKVQVGILLLQGTFVTLLSVMFVVMPSVQTAYQIISQMTILLYLIMYLMMFAAVIYLRHREPNVVRSFRIPGGKVGVWVVGGIGFAASLLAFIVSFIPPTQIPVGSPWQYIGILVVGVIFFAGIPFVIHAMRKPSWMPKNIAPEDAFEPFSWETKTIENKPE